MVQQVQKPPEYNVTVIVNDKKFWLGYFDNLDNAEVAIKKVFETTKSVNQWNTHH